LFIHTIFAIINRRKIRFDFKNRPIIKSFRQSVPLTGRQVSTNREDSFCRCLIQRLLVDPLPEEQKADSVTGAYPEHQSIVVLIRWLARYSCSSVSSVVEADLAAGAVRAQLRMSSDSIQLDIIIIIIIIIILLSYKIVQTCITMCRRKYD